MKRALALGAVSGLLAFGIAPAAQAGELTGGKTPHPTPIKDGNRVHEGPIAASECSFSGLEDFRDEDEEAPLGSTDTPRATQGWGSSVARFTKSSLAGAPFHPGSACKGSGGAPQR